jgi:hypothetical protein
MQNWVPWAVVLMPGAITLVAAVYSLTVEGWKDAATVEALQDLSLHSVFYAPALVAAILGLFMPAEEVKKFGPWIALVSAPVALIFFAFGLRCIVQRGQLERLAEQERERQRLEDDK